MWKNAGFNKKNTGVGEMTARSTRQPTFETNKKKGNQKMIYRKEIGKKITHTENKTEKH